MKEVKEAEGSLFDLFQWSLLQNMSILNDNTTTIQDVEQMVKLFQDFVETELKYVNDPKKKLEILESHIDKEAKWLSAREYAVMLLDGQAKSFQEDIDEKSETLSMMGTPFPQPILDLYDYLKKETAIKVRLEFDEETKRGLLSVGSPDGVNKLNYFGLIKALIGLRFSLGKMDIDLPKELPNYFSFSISSLAFALFFKPKNAIPILFRPLLMIQVKRMFLGYLNECKLKILENSLQKSIPEWHSSIEVTTIDYREIKINPEYLPYIAGKLKQYFSENDFLLLGLILEGKSITPKRIAFDGACSKICYFFREMKGKEGVIKSTKLAIEKCLADYVDFNNQQSKSITPITPDMAHQYVSSTTKLKGKDTIDISDFEEFEEKVNKTK
jgi:hypothetical protein